MVKHVIWDFDGTLFDSYPFMGAAFGAALAKHGIHETYEDIVAQFMASERTAIDFFSKKYGLGPELEREYFECKRVGDMSVIKPFPGAEQTCRAICESGRANYILTHRNNTACEIVALNGMANLFTEIVTSENGFKRKPDPEGIFYLMKKYGMAPGETMIVGDRELEVKLGINAGILSCFFSNGTSRMDTEPDFRVDALEQILKII